MTTSETTIPELFEEYRRALEAGDLPRAVESAVDIEETNPGVPALLTDFEAAVRNGDTELARTVLNQIATAYERQEQDEQARIQRAMAAIEEGSLSADERESLLEFTRTAAATDLNRTGFLVDAVSFFEDEAPGNESDLAKTAEQTKNAETTLDSTRQTAESTAAETTVESAPAILGSDGPDEIAEGNAVTFAVTVGNVGDAETGPLSVEVTTDAGLAVTETSYSVGTLAGDARHEVAVELTGESAGDHAVTASLAEDGETVESTTETFSVKDTPDSVRKAIAGSDDAPLDATDVQQAIVHWADDREVPGTGGEALDTDQLQSFVTEWVQNREEN